MCAYIMKTPVFPRQIVSSSETCDHSPAGGTAEVTDLGPTDAEHARSAEATFVFSMSGSFIMCYRPLGRVKFEQVGTSLISVNPSHRELVQKVIFHLGLSLFISTSCDAKLLSGEKSCVRVQLLAWRNKEDL